MELQFKRCERACLEMPVQDIRNVELTQEIRLPEGMPDIGQILCAWGQTVLRGKEWRRDSAAFSGGMMVWILYTPEDGSPEQCMEGWIPFQMAWDLPEDCPEGKLRIHCITRLVDARSVSARKILVRAGAAAQAEAFVPKTLELWEPEAMPEDVELLTTHWPVRLAVETGERSFLLDEELELPGGGEPEKILRLRLDPEVTEKKVLGNKLVFRGKGRLHILCRCGDGQLQSWDREIPFSQLAELEEEYGPDAQADLVLMPTGLEPELGEDGRLRFKGGIVGQYRITDRQILAAPEDAYSPGREVQTHLDRVKVPAILDSFRETVRGEQNIPAEAERIVDGNLLTDFPRRRQGQNGVELEVPGQIQVLYYGTDGRLQSGTVRWEGKLFVSADESAGLSAVPCAAEMTRLSASAGGITADWGAVMEITSSAEQMLPMLTGVDLGEERRKDPDRPSLILRRAGEDRLWDIAKASGSTVDAIRRANAINGEPAPDKLLLIPVS